MYSGMATEYVSFTTYTPYVSHLNTCITTRVVALQGIRPCPLHSWPGQCRSGSKQHSTHGPCDLNATGMKINLVVSFDRFPHAKLQQHTTKQTLTTFQSSDTFKAAHFYDVTIDCFIIEKRAGLNNSTPSPRGGVTWVKSLRGHAFGHDAVLTRDKQY